jgi:hypothetical protein
VFSNGSKVEKVPPATLARIQQVDRLFFDPLLHVPEAFAVFEPMGLDGSTPDVLLEPLILLIHPFPPLIVCSLGRRERRESYYK